MFNHLHLSPSASFTVLSRVVVRSLTLVDLFRNKKELERINKMAGTHLTLKCGQELRESYPSKLIKSQTCTSMYLPGAHFLRSRFHNLQVATEEHEQAFKSDLQMRGFNPCPVLISPLSSLAWCVVNSAHQGLALQRQTVTGSHLGYGKIMIRTDKFVRIGKLRSLVKEVRAGCIICKSQLDISLDLQPGKVNTIATMKPSDHHTAIQLDLL